MHYPKSIDFIKNRAKQLNKTFPELPLSLCQTATSVALGYKDWFEATKRIASSGAMPSLPDEQVAQEERLARRYQQGRALIDLTNLPSSEVDDFIRHWNLTSNKAPQLSNFETPYETVINDILAFEKGEIAEDDYDNMYYTGRPNKITEGIVIALSGRKHDYYHLSTARLLAMPLYLRGNAGLFLEWENGLYVKLAFPDLFSKEEYAKAEKYLRDHEPLIYEWHTGKVIRGRNNITLQAMVEDAKFHPEDWFVLSCRKDFSDMVNIKHYFPCIKGADFVKFIENKGSLRGLELKWFKAKGDYHGPDAVWAFHTNDMTYNLRLDMQQVEETMPLYISPFKHGPMANIEYDVMVEGGGWRLDEELEVEDEVDDDLSPDEVERLMANNAALQQAIAKAKGGKLES
jgi:hypothetical protein